MSVRVWCRKQRRVEVETLGLEHCVRISLLRRGAPSFVRMPALRLRKRGFNAATVISNSLSFEFEALRVDLVFGRV